MCLLPVGIGTDHQSPLQTQAFIWQIYYRRKTLQNGNQINCFIAEKECKNFQKFLEKRTQSNTGKRK
jgi:hypothetical protein